MVVVGFLDLKKDSVEILRVLLESRGTAKIVHNETLRLWSLAFCKISNKRNDKKLQPLMRLWFLWLFGQNAFVFEIQLQFSRTLGTIVWFLGNHRSSVDLIGMRTWQDLMWVCHYWCGIWFVKNHCKKYRRYKVLYNSVRSKFIVFL